jgi:protocatechuate 3,4-dioxygenase beta subunit
MTTRFSKSRRNALKTLGLAITSLPWMLLASRHSGATSLNNSPPTTTVKANTPWLAGDTQLISVPYPDDNLFSMTDACRLSLTRPSTEGPCYLGVEGREDISLGFSGLPMMLCLQLVDESCKPLPGYLVEVWHCDRDGLYSGDESNSDDWDRFASRMCTKNDKNAEASTWFRGELTTNEQGRVNFKSCFPGWYPGRTTHIHFRVRKKAQGRDSVVSQFCFSDQFCDQLFTTHSLYRHRGKQDTSLKRDFILSRDNEGLIMNLKQNSDGSLLAYKRIVIE